MKSQKNESKYSADNTGHAKGMQDSATIYSDNVVMGGQQGHGFAAEKANHLIDKLTGEDAYLIGGDYAKNGADRLVNNQQIQTKYCSSGSNRLLKYCPRTRKMTTLRVPHPLPDSK